MMLLHHSNPSKQYEKHSSSICYKIVISKKKKSNGKN